MQVLYDRPDAEVLLPSDEAVEASDNNVEPFALRLGDLWFLGSQQPGHPSFRRWRHESPDERLAGLRHALRHIHGPYDPIAALNDLWRYDAMFPTFLEYDLGWQVFAALDHDRREAARLAIALDRGVDLAGQMLNYQHHKPRVAEVTDIVRTVGERMGIPDLDEEVDRVVERLLCGAELTDLEARAQQMLTTPPTPE
ncbi:hypothetical protein [Blastococcus sp. TF02A-35]|uniref:hypothetical protein n=1 Tax=Blastococcus sp. TF02A-35 TaxID=2559612 RepID=UPI0010739D16|nr:hypothetical protein [Blastococcus sp. TF02A_35]TFV43758.1 hypothetical protein E4P43_19475 [Blastococcus sp. TF02A_35]